MLGATGRWAEVAVGMVVGVAVALTVLPSRTPLVSNFSRREDRREGHAGDKHGQIEVWLNYEEHLEKHKDRHRHRRHHVSESKPLDCGTFTNTTGRKCAASDLLETPVGNASACAQWCNAYFKYGCCEFAPEGDGTENGPVCAWANAHALNASQLAASGTSVVSGHLAFNMCSPMAMAPTALGVVGLAPQHTEHEPPPTPASPPLAPPPLPPSDLSPVVPRAFTGNVSQCFRASSMSSGCLATAQQCLRMPKAVPMAVALAWANAPGTR